MKISTTKILFIAGLFITSLSASAVDTLTTEHGIKYIQLSQGNGTHPTSHQKVKIVYSRKNASGQIVESNELSKPFEFRIDDNKVIPGLDEIVKQMSIGEELFCIIPASLGHGAKGVKGYIDPNSTLYLYIQIIDIE